MNLTFAEITAGIEWGQDGWRKMTWLKVFVVDKIVEWGFRIIVSDLDVVWFKDPIFVIPLEMEADMIFSHDGVWSHTSPSPEHFVLEGHGSAHTNMNSGVY